MEPLSQSQSKTWRDALNFEDKLRTIFAVPLGFLLGVITSAIIIFSSIAHWLVIPIFVIAVLALIFFNRVSDRLSLHAMETLSDLPKEQLEEMKAKRLVGAHSRWPRYVFIIAACMGYATTLIWSATDILSLINWYG